MEEVKSINENVDKVLPNEQISQPDILKFSSSIPFPVLVVDKPSAKVVCLLKDAMFSKHSENTAISTYLFQSWATDNTFEEIKNVLEKISMSEMRHLDALAKAVVAFGGNPNFSNSNGAYWSGSLVNQKTTPAIFLKNNIEAEKRAIRDYRNIQSQISNKSLIALIDKIISDEVVHIQIFENFLSKFN